MNVYAPSDFAARLANDELTENEAAEAVGTKGAEGLEVVGVVKCIEGSSTLIGFSRALSCPRIDWIPLPIEMLESATHLRSLLCDGVKYPAVRAKFKKPADQRQDVAFLLGLCAQQGAIAHSLRRSRYRGLAKASLQHYLTAAAINVVRIDAHLTGKPHAPTRTSPLTALRPTG